MDPRRKAPDSWQAERARNCRLPSLVGGGGSPRSNPKSSSASGRPPLRRCRRKTSASPSTEESPFPRLWRPTSSPPSIPPPFSERPTMNPGHGNWRASLQICARWLSCSPRMVGEGLADLESTPPLRDRTESRPCWRRTRGRHGDQSVVHTGSETGLICTIKREHRRSEVATAWNDARTARIAISQWTVIPSRSVRGPGGLDPRAAGERRRAGAERFV